jgi:hypothetical protein
MKTNDARNNLIEILNNFKGVLEGTRMPSFAMFDCVQRVMIKCWETCILRGSDNVQSDSALLGEIENDSSL